MNDPRTETQGRQGGAMMRIARFLRDRRGVAAVEFAFIAPLLLTLYLVTMEVAQGIETNKKVSRVGSMVADLVTQQRETEKKNIESIMQIGEAILYPYVRTRPVIEVTEIGITNEKTPRVLVKWSRKLANGVFSAGAAKESLTNVPDQLKIPGTFLIRVSARLDYRPVISWTAEQKTSLGLLGAFDNINMDEVYYLRPRMSERIKCDDC